MPDGSTPPPAPAPLEKFWFRIGEAAQLVNTTPATLHYWETEFSALRPRRSRKGQRVYSRRDVELLKKIRHLLHVEGYTIDGARRRLRTAEACPHCGKELSDGEQRSES
jgi:DNA-binding transcriptional MerR regulator